MSVSGVRAGVDIDLGDLEKRLRTAGSPSGAVEDPLAELARLVEASRPKAAEPAAAPRVAAPQQAAPPPAQRPAPPPPAPPALEAGALRPAFDDAADGEPELDAAGEPEAVEGQEEPPFDYYPAQPPAEFPFPRARFPRARSSRWVWTVSGLAVAGVAMIGAVFALKGGIVPGMSKAPPYIAAAVGPTKVQPPSDATVSSPSDSASNLLKDNTQAGKVNVVNHEEQPVDLNAQTAPAPATTGAGSAASGGPMVRGTVDTPVVLANPQPTPAASPFPEPKPVRTISLRPDGTPIPATAADAAASPPPSSQPVRETPKPAAKAPSDAAGAQASTPKIDLPTKLPPKSSARVVVAKTDTTAPGGATDAGEPMAKPEKAAKPKPQAAAAEPAAPAAAEPVAASSGAWAVQLAAPRSEAEAKSVVSKLSGKYASALGGSALGVHKGTSSAGDTVYRVRVTGLSKADAAALCARVKGDGGQCFVAK